MDRVRRVSETVLHAFGNVFFESRPVLDVSLTPAQSDALIQYQSRLDWPLYLGERAFQVTNIVDSESSSVKIQKALLKHHIILEEPTTAVRVAQMRHTIDREIPVKTERITKNFPHQLASTGLSMSGQKLVVALLCFWHEEIRRWYRLEAEEREIRGQIEYATRVNNTRALSFFSAELNKLHRKRRLVWSQREENREMVGGTSNSAGPSGMSGVATVASRAIGVNAGIEEHGLTTDGARDQLPSYVDSTMHGGTTQVATGGAARIPSTGSVDELPEYENLVAQGDANDNGGAEMTANDDVVEGLESTGAVDQLPGHQT